MAVEHPPLNVSAETDLELLLDEADKSLVLLERRGVRYRLSLDEEATRKRAVSKREQELRILDETIGSWANLDIDKIIEDIYEARRVGSRYPVDP